MWASAGLLALILGLGGCSASSHSEALGSEVEAAVPGWVKTERLPSSAVPGARIFAASGCTTCHTYLASGARNLGAPDLSAEARRHRGIRFQIAHLRCPSCVVHGSAMPAFSALGPRKLRRVAIFLEASKGRR